MNFLAHIYLSGNDEDLKIGNFIADFVKGRAYNTFDPAIQRGIKLHRAIDHYTDTHPVVSQSKQKLWEKYRHFSGVIVDIYYDHFLAINWSEFSKESLTTYVDEFYSMITSHGDKLPESVNHMMPYMIRKNWLLNYANFEGIEDVMQGMSRRTKHDSKMEQSVEDLKFYYEEFGDEFAEFFPQLETHVSKWILENMD